MNPRLFLVSLLSISTLFACRATSFDPVAGPGDAVALLDVALERFAAERDESETVLADPAASPQNRAVARQNLAAARQRLRGELRSLAIDFPRNGAVQRSAGAVLYAASDLVEAERHLDAALAADPRDTEAAFLRAQLAYDAGNTPLARRLASRHLAVRPDHAGLWELDALLAVDAGDPVGAEERLGRAERLGAPAWRLAYNRGLVAESRGDSAAAMSHYRTALEQLPEHTPSQQRLRALEAH